MKGAKSGNFCILLDTPTPRCRSARLGVELRLGEPEAQISALFGSARQTSPPRHSIAPPRRTYESYIGSSLQLVLEIIHWINEDPNK